MKIEKIFLKLPLPFSWRAKLFARFMLWNDMRKGKSMKEAVDGAMQKALTSSREFREEVRARVDTLIKDGSDMSELARFKAILEKNTEVVEGDIERFTAIPQYSKILLDDQKGKVQFYHQQIARLQDRIDGMAELA